MTDEQIIKALDCCHSELGNMCSICPLFDPDNDYCEDELHKNALDLINRQKAENKELRFDKIIAERHEKDARDLFVDCTKQLDEAKAEIERLKKRNTLLLKKKCKDINTTRKTIKSETIKEFAERLKGYPIVENESKEIAYLFVEVRDIDNLVKEMTEGKE